jgi:hypothetical protein
MSATATKRVVTVGSTKAAVSIYAHSDHGYVCEYNPHSPLNHGDDAAWVQGSGTGESEAEAVKAFVADCHRRGRKNY